MKAVTIDNLLSGTPDLWQGNRANCNQRTLPSGHRQLDAQLAGGGWPLGAVTEIITDAQGLGELSLLFPTLAELSNKGQWLIMVDPPWVPYPAALLGHGLALDRLLLVHSNNQKESLWACEQALYGSHGGVVLAWPERISFRHLRRLQLAAESNTKAAFLFRPIHAITAPSPAALRLRLQGGTTDIRIEILKCRGPRPTNPIRISPPFSPSLSRAALPPGHAATDSTGGIPGHINEAVELPASTTLN